MNHFYFIQNFFTSGASEIKLNVGYTLLLVNAGHSKSYIVQKLLICVQFGLYLSYTYFFPPYGPYPLYALYIIN